MTIETKLLEQNHRESRYEALVELPARRFSGTGPRRASLVFTVSAEGALGFDNRQPQAGLCKGGRVSRALAAEMGRAARAQVPGALEGRTARGMGLELRAHYLTYRLGVLRRHAMTTELGSPDPAAPDYDDNAFFFEAPLRGLPRAAALLLRRLRRV